MFTPGDWPLVRFAEAPVPVLETVLGVAELKREPAVVRGSRWKERARRVFPPVARPLLDLITASGPWPDFLDHPAADMDEALEMVAATPKAVLQSDLASCWRQSVPPPPWVQDLAAGNVDAVGLLVRALRAFYLSCVTPSWPEIHDAFYRDLAERMAVLVQGGLGGVFGSLHDELALRDGAVERTSQRSTGLPDERSLEGRGLLIVPSVLWSGPPLVAVGSRALGGGALVYAAEPTPGGAYGRGATQPLVALIGRTRASVLEAIRVPCGTADLAARVGVSAASASEHAAVLRQASLILTSRYGREVRHSLTPLGRSLLNSTVNDAAVSWSRADMVDEP